MVDDIRGWKMTGEDGRGLGRILEVWGGVII